MHAPVGRLGGAVAMLALFYWTLLPSAGAVRREPDGSDGIEGLLQSSRAALQAGRYEAALAPTQTLVARYPSQHVYVERLATIYHALGRYSDEAEAWHRFMEHSPTPWDACPAVAEAHTAAGDPTGATAAYEQCWTAPAWSPEAAFFLARDRERRGRLAEADTLYRQALAIDSRHGDSEIGLARLALHQRQLDAAQQMALTVVARDPRHTDALLIVALAAQRRGDADMAREFFERTLRVDERYTDAHIGLGILEFGEQRVEVARRHFERALDLDAARRPDLIAWLSRTGSAR